MRLCPCGEGQIEGKIKFSEGGDKDNPPLIVCPYCSDVYCFKWYLNWNRWTGSYWYGWKMGFKS